MDLSKAIKISCIQLNKQLKNKDDTFREIAELVVSSSETMEYSAKEIQKELKKREKIGSTGFGNGIAIPHCSLEKMKELESNSVDLPLRRDRISFRATLRRASRKSLMARI